MRLSGKELAGRGCLGNSEILLICLKSSCLVTLTQDFLTLSEVTSEPSVQSSLGLCIQHLSGKGSIMVPA